MKNWLIVSIILASLILVTGIEECAKTTSPPPRFYYTIIDNVSLCPMTEFWRTFRNDSALLDVNFVVTSTNLSGSITGDYKALPNSAHIKIVNIANDVTFEISDATGSDNEGWKAINTEIVILKIGESTIKKGLNITLTDINATTPGMPLPNAGIKLCREK